MPVGYADGLSRHLSNRLELLVGGVRCPQVGRITMDMSLLDVTALRGRVGLGDEVVIIGRQGGEEVTADELAATLGHDQLRGRHRDCPPRAAGRGVTSPSTSPVLHDATHITATADTGFRSPEPSQRVRNAC